MGFTMFRKLFPSQFSLKGLAGTRSYSSDPSNLSASHQVTGIEKRLLVWAGKYKTIEEVPAFVSHSLIQTVRNRMRIRIANYMMAGTAIGCLLMVYLGKQDVKAGKSLQRENMEWHRQIKEQHEKEKAAELAK